MAQRRRKRRRPRPGRLPTITGKHLIRLVEREGHLDRLRENSHGVIFGGEGVDGRYMFTTIPNENVPLRKGLRGAILKQMGLDLDDLRDLIEKHGLR